MPFFSSAHRLASSQTIFSTHYFSSFYVHTFCVHTNPELSTLAEGSAQGVVRILNVPIAQLWQLTLALGYPAIGLGLLAGFFSLVMALLYLRIHRLTSLAKGKDQRIKSLLSVDPLTGLVNRTALCMAGNRLLHTQPKAEIALITLDINRFKTVNDAFGHRIADELLRQAGQRMHTYLGPKDMLARTGGDEFSLLLNPGDEARAHAMAEQVLSAIHQPFRIQAQLVYVQSRLGIAFAQNAQAKQIQEQTTKPTVTEPSVTEPSVSEETAPPDFCDLLLQANMAMAQVGSAATGVNCRHTVFCSTMKDVIASKVFLQQSLVSAIEQQQLRVRYQAIVDVQTGQPVGFEALVRWQHPERGLMRPDDFLSAAEELGLSFEIDRWVLETVCQQLTSWRAKGLSPSVSVNLSGSHLSRSDLVEYIRGLLARYAIEPVQLSVEVTEGVMIANLDQAIDTLVQLKNIGIGISLDDFGTGYSSLNYLQKLPIDVLKIDRSFIRCLGQSDEECPVNSVKPSAVSARQDELIVNTILSLASALNIRVVVEGVERLDQWQILKKTSCGYVQGNYFSGAIEADCAQALFQQGRERALNLSKRT